MISALMFIFVLLLVTALIVHFMYMPSVIVDAPMESYEDHHETTTTTTVTTTEPVTYQVVGEIPRSWENDQPFVIDPFDNKKYYLNTTDDLFESGNGEIWKLV